MSHPSTLDTSLTSFSDLHRDSEEASIISNHSKTKQFLSARRSIVRSNDGEEDKPSKRFTVSSSHMRSRKPPVRYIDEFSRYVPSSNERQRFCGAPMDKILSVKTSSKHDNGHKILKSVKHTRYKGRYGKSPNNLFTTNRDARGLSSRITVDISKEFSPVTVRILFISVFCELLNVVNLIKMVSILMNVSVTFQQRLDSDSDEESDSDTSGNLARNGFKNSDDRRKHQKAWALPEVVKLVEGISQYGVGHWTEIQRLFFPTSTCRTPVDLRVCSWF